MLEPDQKVMKLIDFDEFLKVFDKNCPSLSAVC